MNGTQNPTLRATAVFRRNLNAWRSGTRVVVNQGGTRSSKTYSLCQLMILIAIERPGIKIDVLRKHMPSLRATAMADFFSILEGAGIYQGDAYAKGAGTYQVNGSTISFYSVDEEKKVRGRKRDILWLNEANEFDYNDYRQLLLRTSGQIFLDYNPSDEFHWIYDHVLPRPDVEFIQSTYRDNPFLGREIVAEIELLRDTDEEYWQIFGEGERGRSRETIYTNWTETVLGFDPHDAYAGIDFGFNHPTACVLVQQRERAAHVTEVMYERFLTQASVGSMLRERFGTMGISMATPLYCDSAEPDRIQDLLDSGFNAHPAKKAVMPGIDAVKSLKLTIEPGSIGLAKEIKHYKFRKDRSGRTLDEPVKLNDDAMDALRYAVYTHLDEGVIDLVGGRYETAW